MTKQENVWRQVCTNCRRYLVADSSIKQTRTLSRVSVRLLRIGFLREKWPVASLMLWLYRFGLIVLQCHVCGGCTTKLAAFTYWMLTDLGYNLMTHNWSRLHRVWYISAGWPRTTLSHLIYREVAAQSNGRCAYSHSVCRRRLYHNDNDSLS